MTYIRTYLKQHEIRSQLVLVTPPENALVLGLPILKKHCRLPLEEDFTDEDDNLTVYGMAAQALVESHAEISLLEQQFRLDLQYLPRRDPGADMHIVRLERTPVTSVEHIKYYDEDNALQTLDPEFYYVYPGTTPPTVWINPDGFDSSTPATRLDSFQVTFNTGCEYQSGADEQAVEAAAKQAILFLVGTFFQKRETIHLWTGKPLMEMPLGYRMCIDALRWRL